MIGCDYCAYLLSSYRNFWRVADRASTIVAITFDVLAVVVAMLDLIHLLYILTANSDSMLASYFSHICLAIVSNKYCLVLLTFLLCEALESGLVPSTDPTPPFCFLIGNSR